MTLRELAAPGRNRFVLQIGFEVAGQGGRRIVAQVGRLLQTTQRDHLQIAIDLGAAPCGVAADPVPGPATRLPWARRPETAGGRSTCGRESSPETVDIAGDPHLATISRSLFGGHVGGRPEDGARACEAGRIGHLLGESKVHDVRLSLIVDQDVRRLEVAVQDATAVSKIDRPTHGGQDRRDLAWRQRSATQLCRPASGPPRTSC